METREKIRQIAENLRKEFPSNPINRPIWEGAVKLLEQSNFGEKNASVEIETPLPFGRSENDEILSDSFDKIQWEILTACRSILEGYGSVSIIPYPKGMGTRSMTLKFEAENEKLEDS